jgi:hypothetical protein
MMAKCERQPIERDSAAEMVDMVKTNIGSEPAQDDRKIVMRTAVKGSLMYVPSLIASPKRVLELVLNIEQPDPERSADHRDRQMHEQEWTYAHGPDRDSRYQQNGEIRHHRAQPRLPTTAHESDRLFSGVRHSAAQLAPRILNATARNAEPDEWHPATLSVGRSPIVRECFQFLTRAMIIVPFR